MHYAITEGKFQTRDGLKLHFRYFKHPQAEDTLILLHGHGEHSGRYQKFAAHLEDKKVSLAMVDLRGYGLSDGEACYVDSFQDYLNDLSDFTTFLKRDYSLKDRFLLFGHSNGGLVALTWALKYPDAIKALFLSSPYLGLKLPKPLILINDFLCRVAPHFVYQNPVYPPYLTHNPEELVRYKSDNLMRRKVTARLLSEMMTAHHFIEGIPHFKFPFPVLVLMAGLDRIVDPAKTHLFYKKLSAPYKDLHVFEGFYHEIFNELGQEQVFEVLRGQMDAAKPYIAA